MNKQIIPFYIPSTKRIIKSKGCYYFDSEGTKYIDFESGVWCTSIGHSNDRLIRVMENQVRESIHHGYKFWNTQAEELSVELQRLIGFDKGQSIFLSSGSEAVNLAVTMARNQINRKKILKLDNSYLSAFGYGKIAADNDALINIRFNDTASISDIDFSDIAAFVVETGGASVEIVRFPDYDFIKQLTQTAIKNGCLIIADEVTTGMGRTGKWFGFQHYNIVPDIVVTGKALGNGYPVSAVTVNSSVARKYEKSPFSYAQSHQNDPLGCAIGIEVIKIIEENEFIERCHVSGEYFSKQLEDLKARHNDKIKEIRARGLMLALEFESCINGEWINGKLFESGFVTGFKLNTLRFLPPFVIEKSEIDSLTNKLDNLLRDNGPFFFNE